jgi:hypothetical protein
MPRALRKWTLSLKVLPFAAVAVACKFILHTLGWEVISLSPLFSGLLAATVFLLGFLISGVLTDYKESEKLPGEIAVSLEAIADEATILHQGGKREPALRILSHLVHLSEAIRNWFYGKRSSDELMEDISGLNEHFHVVESLTVPPFIARMKQEQTALRRVLIRIRTIRDTSFISSGYTIAEVTATLLIAGLTMAKIDPFHESLFFVGMITFLLTYMLALIKDLDNPFEYGGGAGGVDEVSLKPLEETAARLARRVAALRNET